MIAAATSGYIPALLLIVGAVLVILALYLPRRRFHRERSESIGVLSELRAQQTQDQLNEILVEIQQFSRDTLARMDTKIRMMHQMLAECERLTGRLEKAVEEAKELLQKLEESRTGGVVSGAAAPTVKMPSPEQTHLSPALPSAEKPINPLHARVLELFDSGQGLRQISAETGLQVGEIELILGLHGRKPIR